MPAQKHRKISSPVPQQPRIKRQDVGTPSPLVQHQQPQLPASQIPQQQIPRLQSQAPITPRPHPHPHQAKQLEHDLSETWAACGKCALSIGFLDLAFKSCSNALERNAANVLALCTIAATYREDDLKTKSDRGAENALNILNDAIRLYPHLANEPMLLKELAKCQFLKGLFEQCHMTLDRILQTDQHDAEVWLFEGKSLIRLHRQSPAIKASAIHAFRNALTKVQKSQMNTENCIIKRACHSELAAISFSEGNFDGAAMELANTINLPVPDEQQKFELSCTWCALAITKEANSDLNSALQICDTAERVLGVYPRLLITRAFLLLLNPNHERAIEAIDTLQAVINKCDEPRDSKEGDFLPHYLLGCAYTILDDPPKAYEALHIALGRAPTSAFPWLSVGALYLRLGQLKDSLAAYTKAAKLKEEMVGYPTCVVTWKGLACVYERCDKQFTDAANACSKASIYAGLAGDQRTKGQLEQRSHALLAASRSEAPSPELQNPPEPPLQLLRDLVLMSPEERIELMNRQSIQQQHSEQQQQQPHPILPASQPSGLVHYSQAPPPPQQAQQLSHQPQQIHPPPPPPQQRQIPPPPHQYSPHQQGHFHPSPAQQHAVAPPPPHGAAGQHFSPRHPHPQNLPFPQQQGQYVNREGQSTPLARRSSTLPSPTNPMNPQPQYYQYGHGKILAPQQPPVMPQLRGNGQYNQYPRPVEHVREYS